MREITLRLLVNLLALIQAIVDWFRRLLRMP